MGRCRLNLSLPSDISQVENLYIEVSRFCEELGCGRRMTHRIHVAADELFTNIVQYAYENGSEHRVEITLAQEQNGVTLRIVDDGRPFDPTLAAAPESGCPLDERKIGGLGIHLCKKLVNEMTYQREGGRNVVTLFFGSEPFHADPA